MDQGHEDRGADDRPQEAERMSIDAHYQGLGEVELMRDPGTKESSDEAHHDRDEQAAARPARDPPADRTYNGRDEDEKKQLGQCECHERSPYLHGCNCKL